MKNIIAVPELEYNSCKGCIGEGVNSIGCRGAKNLYSKEIYSCADNKTIFIEEKEDIKVKTKEEELTELEAKVAELKKEIANERKELFLSISSFGDLVVKYGNKDKSEQLFYINCDGAMHFSLNNTTLKLYNEWVANGKQVSNREVSWKNKTYFIDIDYILVNLNDDQVFDFEYLRPCSDCYDENIIITENDRIPVIFG